ncbi:four helix bundle protein [Aquimarina intermedia]|uniref:Four helix bundle protein n=1 Tax=Aquimarina intermedia TaxID=350814 RepID=A0A5S5CH79_9FLAO|nr:four helix bundle protein [Aquimarina intermedia]TYP77373.1 four helix bundle protein [Aquimarina intermedia]
MKPEQNKTPFKFEDLIIYNKSVELGESIQQQISKFPNEERARLGLFFSNAADALAINIAVGSENNKETFLLALEDASNAAYECVVCSTKAKLRGYISEEEDQKNREDVVELNKMITSFKNHIQSKLNS